MSVPSLTWILSLVQSLYSSPVVSWPVSPSFFSSDTKEPSVRSFTKFLLPHFLTQFTISLHFILTNYTIIILPVTIRITVKIISPRTNLPEFPFSPSHSSLSIEIVHIIWVLQHEVYFYYLSLQWPFPLPSCLPKKQFCILNYCIDLLISF